MPAKLINVFIHSSSKYLLSIFVLGIISNSHRVCAKGKKNPVSGRACIQVCRQAYKNKPAAAAFEAWKRKMLGQRDGEVCSGVPSEWAVGEFPVLHRKCLTEDTWVWGEGPVGRFLSHKHELQSWTSAPLRKVLPWHAAVFQCRGDRREGPQSLLAGHTSRPGESQAK